MLALSPPPLFSSCESDVAEGECSECPMCKPKQKNQDGGGMASVRSLHVQDSDFISVA